MTVAWDGWYAQCPSCGSMGFFLNIEENVERQWCFYCGEYLDETA